MSPLADAVLGEAGSVVGVSSGVMRFSRTKDPTIKWWWWWWLNVGGSPSPQTHGQTQANPTRNQSLLRSQVRTGSRRSAAREPRRPQSPLENAPAKALEVQHGYGQLVVVVVVVAGKL